MKISSVNGVAVTKIESLESIEFKRRFPLDSRQLKIGGNSVGNRECGKRKQIGGVGRTIDFERTF